jgi:predicted O-methyltransferase YrrM
MKKIVKFLKGIFLIIKNPWLLNNVINDNNEWKKYTRKKYNLEMGLPVITFSDLFKDFTVTLNTYSFLGGGSLPTDIALLKKLAETIDNCRFFEIGTWRGESVINVSENAKSCATLNLSKHELEKLGLNDRYINQVGLYSKADKKITHLEGNSMNFNYESLNQKYDLIFIDGDHHYEVIKEDTKNIFKYLAKDDSIVVWHDYGYTPGDIRYEVLAGILDGVAYNKHQFLYHVANTKCAIYINRIFNKKKLIKPLIPEFNFKVKLSMEKLPEETNYLKS